MEPRKKNGVVNRVKGSRNVQKTKTGKFLLAQGRDYGVSECHEQSFSGMTRSEARLIGVKKRVRGKIGKKTR